MTELNFLYWSFFSLFSRLFFFGKRKPRSENDTRDSESTGISTTVYNLLQVEQFSSGQPIWPLAKFSRFFKFVQIKSDTDIFTFFKTKCLHLYSVLLRWISGTFAVLAHCKRLPVIIGVRMFFISIFQRRSRINWSRSQGPHPVFNLCQPQMDIFCLWVLRVMRVDIWGPFCYDGQILQGNGFSANLY